MRIEQATGAATSLIDPAIPESLAEAVARVLDVERPTLVLGSRQRDDLVDWDAVARDGVDVVRRHSGGGAVLLVPEDCLWVDVLLPVSDRRWVDDVAAAFYWLGDLWSAALSDLGRDASVHRGKLQKTTWGELVCFGALGPGEVVADDRKVVGMSQQRKRVGARFQCSAHGSWRPEELLRLLRLTPQQRRDAAVDLQPRAAGVPISELRDAVLSRLALP